MNNEESNTSPINVRGMYYCPDGKVGINYLIGLVDLHEAEGLQNSFFWASASESLVEFCYNYNGFEPSSEVKTYLIPPFYNQQFLGGVLKEYSLEVTNFTNTSETQTTKIKPTKSKGLGLENHELDQPRVVIIQSSTNSDNYFVLIFVKTVVANDRNLQVGTSVSSINCSYNPNQASPITESDYVVAVTLIPSTKDQFTEVVITNNDGGTTTTEITTEMYNKPDSI
jgi:hypothetical protein